MAAVTKTAGTAHHISAANALDVACVPLAALKRCKVWVMAPL